MFLRSKTLIGSHDFLTVPDCCSCCITLLYPHSYYMNITNDSQFMFLSPRGLNYKERSTNTGSFHHPSFQLDKSTQVFHIKVEVTASSDQSQTRTGLLEAGWMFYKVRALLDKKISNKYQELSASVCLSSKRTQKCDENGFPEANCKKIKWRQDVAPSSTGSSTNESANLERTDWSDGSAYLEHNLLQSKLVREMYQCCKPENPEFTLTLPGLSHILLCSTSLMWNRNKQGRGWGRCLCGCHSQTHNYVQIKLKL